MFCGDKDKFVKWQENYNGLIDDEFIKSKIKNLVKFSWVTNPQIINYVKNRCPDAYTIEESFRRILKGDTAPKPLCPMCGKPVKYIGKQAKKYTHFCSIKCTTNNREVQLKRQATDKARHGGVLPWVESNKDKKKIEKRKRTLIKKYGTKNLYSIPEVKEKIKKTNLQKFGAESPMQNEKIKSKHWESLKNGDNFKGVSKFEKLLGEKLIEIYGPEDVKLQYSDSRYPFHCDFYIVSKDLFIEYQGSQYHHFHPFNPKNPQDLAELKRLKTKSLSYGKKPNQYKGMIKIWTQVDVKKRELAKRENLNFIELWGDQDLDACLSIINDFIQESKSSIV